MVRNAAREAISLKGLTRSLLPYLSAQVIVLAAVLAWPSLLWHRDAPGGQSGNSATTPIDEQTRMLQQQLDRNADEVPPFGSNPFDAPRH